MTSDARLVVATKGVLSITEANLTVVASPIAVILPAPTFLGMTPFGPPLKVLKELEREPVKGLFGTTGTVIVGPASDYWIKFPN